MEKKVGIYGGSFNPIHFGHIGLARWVVEHTDLDEVWLMVSPNNPLKESSTLADEKIRLAQAREKITEEVSERPLPEGKAIVVSDFELHLPKPTYTQNTLLELTKAYPETAFTLIIGEDNWLIRDKWRNWDWIEENFPIIVYPRRGCNTGKAVDAPLYDISSTEIREKQKEKQREKLTEK